MRNAHGYRTTPVVLGVCFAPSPVGQLIFQACIPDTAAGGFAGYIGIERMNYVKTSELLTLITTTGQLNE